MTTILASLFNLAGPDLIIILLIFLMVGGVPILAVVLIVWLLRRASSATSGNAGRYQPPPFPAAAPKERLEQLDVLRQSGRITDTEYEEQRRRVLEEI